MLELIINRDKEKKTIALVENGKLLERYEETQETNRNEGNIYIGTVKDILSGMQSAFIDIGTEKNSFIHLKDILPKVDEKNEKLEIKEDIRKIIKQNDKLLVQVKKDSNDKKGARVSTHISLPSRYIVLMPNTNIITISQKIEDKKERERLLEIVKKSISKGNGAVIRTSAKGKNEDEILKDIKVIEKKWEDINASYKDYNSNKPKLIYKSEDIIEKIIIDMIDKNLETIVVNKKEDEKMKSGKGMKNMMKNINMDDLKNFKM